MKKHDPAQLRKSFKAYQKRHDHRTLALAVAAFAEEIDYSSSAVWHWLAGERKIRSIIAERIKKITDGESS